jgi:pyruvate carboxylase
MVGDLAIFMVQNELSPENIVEKGEALAFPDSVVSYFKGMMGQPAWGFPEDVQRIVLKGEEPFTCRPGELLPPADFETIRGHLKEYVENPSQRDILSWCLYPKVLEDYLKARREYGYIVHLGSHVFFHGLAPGETHTVNIADGKTLVIKYLGLGDKNEDGTRTVHFMMNGSRREINIIDKSAPETISNVVLADPEDKMHIASSIPGAVSKIQVKVGDKVEERHAVIVVEAMKMETSVTTQISGTVAKILVKEGQTVKAGELMMVLE